MTETEKKTYESPLSSRYSSQEMQCLFSPDTKYTTWRRLWIALAESQKELGLHISDQQIEELKKHIAPINYSVAEKYELELQHDVMAHIHAYGEQCPLAKPIIHLGATSCYVTDNTDLLVMVEGLKIISVKLKKTLKILKTKALQYADIPTLSYTHFQPAQPTTVGKRLCCWIQDLDIVLSDIERHIKNTPLLGVKGTTGTQASFLSLFEGDHAKVQALDTLVCEKMGFDKCVSISGQTYTRLLDSRIISSLVHLAETAHKIGTDFRLLAHLEEFSEPFGSKQVGSSAMPYKKNPIKTERICSLARYLISIGQNPHYTTATQWLERSLDDSANRRLTIPESFLTADAILELMISTFEYFVINEPIIKRHLKEQLPFMLTETILMECVKKGGDRQEIHEKIREHSFKAKNKLNEKGGENPLLQIIGDDPSIPLSFTELQSLLRSFCFVGRAPEQVKEFLNDRNW